MVKHIILWKLKAEMTADEKNAISHRGAAVRKFAQKLARRMGLVEDLD